MGKSRAQRLCEAIKEAKVVTLGSRAPISAERIRRLVLQLPQRTGGTACRLTPLGIRIVGAAIRGRLDLDNATPVGGGALCPLEFRGCTFEGGFSGAHGHFSRLSFRACRFRNPRPKPSIRGKARVILPTLDLSGATIGADLDLRGVKPAGRSDHLWIRAIGAKIDGELDLSCSRLRAPADSADQLFSEPSVEALDLSLAQIRGDFQFLNRSRCKGRINFRNSHITGDIWMGGARLEARNKECLFLQSATIDGSVLLDGRPEKADGSGKFHWFEARGEINLMEAEIGGSVDLTDVKLIAANSDVCLRFTSARVGTQLAIGSSEPEEKSRITGRVVLQGLRATAGIFVSNVFVGTEAEDVEGPATIDARSIVAKRLLMFGVEPLLRDERNSRDVAPEVRTLSLDLGDAQLESLHILASRFSGQLIASPITCTGEAVFDARVDHVVDLGGADIEGSLDISGLRLGPDARGLSLKDATIGRALKFARTTSPEGPLQELVRAREAELSCLRGATLLETLWRYRAGPDKMLLCQVAFLRRRGLIQPLDSRDGTIEMFVREHGHSVRSTLQAEEYVRLAAAYGGAGGDEPVWLLRRREDAPFVEPDPDPQAADDTDPQPAGAAEPAGPADAPAPDEPSRPEAEPPPVPEEKSFGWKSSREHGGRQDQFAVVGTALRGNRFVDASFRVMPGESGQGPAASHPRLNVAAAFEPFSPPLVNMPVPRGLYLYHPPAREDLVDWIGPPVADRTQEEGDEDRLRALEALLLPYVQPGASIYGRVDLTDLSCDTLDDGGGASWGRHLRIHMDRFIYRQATWVSDPPDEGFRGWVRRLTNRLIAERAPLRLIDKYEWGETRLEPADFWEPWQIRRNWIYQQFELDPDLPSPTRHRIEQSEYRPQPFEQAIRVARSEGREDFAAQFEILKRRIEWSLFSQRSRRPLLMVGIAAALLWLVLTGGIHFGTFVAIAGLLAVLLVGTRPRWDAHPLLGRIAKVLLVAAIIAATAAGLGWHEGEPWEGARNFLVALLILVGLRYISTTSDWLMRNLFGYLRLPINAIVSLIVAFLVGWAGVELANDRKMLIIDVEPVASLVARDATQQKIYVGTARGVAGAHHVHCADEIDEPLYALDVLIPLIDLRQENRCEVGRAIPFDEADAISERKPVAYAVEMLLGPILDSEGFWAAAKALYAIAGWFLVSLAILTFAVANRAHGDPGG